MKNRELWGDNEPGVTFTMRIPEFVAEMLPNIGGGDKANASEAVRQAIYAVHWASFVEEYFRLFTVERLVAAGFSASVTCFDDARGVLKELDSVVEFLEEAIVSARARAAKGREQVETVKEQLKARFLAGMTILHDLKAETISDAQANEQMLAKVGLSVTAFREFMESAFPFTITVADKNGTHETKLGEF